MPHFKAGAKCLQLGDDVVDGVHITIWWGEQMATDVNVIGRIGSSGGSSISYPFLAVLGRAVWQELQNKS